MNFYCGYWGRKVLFSLFILSIALCVFLFAFGQRYYANLTLMAVMFFWFGFWGGWIEGHHSGYGLRRQDEYEEKNKPYF